MKLFVHDPDSTSPEAVEVSETALIRELVGHHGDLAWLAEAETPLELDITVTEAGLHDGHHVFRGPHRKVEVNLYVAAERRANHSFAPSLRSERILAWGVKHLKLGEVADFELIDRSSSATVDPDRRIGTLTQRAPAALDLELRRTLRDVNIVVNATRYSVAAGPISFAAVVALAYPTPPGPNPEYTVQYRKGPSADPKRSLLEGQHVEAREGMIFNVTATDKS